MIEYLIIATGSVGLTLLVVWLAKRHRRTEMHWGNQPGQSSILTGAQTDAPQFFPTEPAPEPTVNGAPFDEMSHQASVEVTSNIND